MVTKMFFGASAGRDFFSKIVRFWEFGEKITHIFYIPRTSIFYGEKTIPEYDIVKNVLENDFDVVEAWYKVRFGKWRETHKDDPYIVFSVFVDSTNLKNAELWLKKQIGKKYDYLGLLNFPLRSKDFDSPNRWFCSELCFALSLHAKLTLLKYTTPDEVSPRLFCKSPVLKVVAAWSKDTGGLTGSDAEEFAKKLIKG